MSQMAIFSSTKVLSEINTLIYFLRYTKPAKPNIILIDGVFEDFPEPSWAPSFDNRKYHLPLPTDSMKSPSAFVNGPENVKNNNVHTSNRVMANEVEDISSSDADEDDSDVVSFDLKSDALKLLKVEPYANPKITSSSPSGKKTPTKLPRIASRSSSSYSRLPLPNRDVQLRRHKYFGEEAKNLFYETYHELHKQRALLLNGEADLIDTLSANSHGHSHEHCALDNMLLRRKSSFAEPRFDASFAAVAEKEIVEELTKNFDIDNMSHGGSHPSLLHMSFHTKVREENELIFEKN